MEWIPNSVQLNLIGHSIGVYMVLQLVIKLSAHGYTIKHTIGLFPAIERIVQTPNGRVFNILRRIGFHYFLLYGLVPAMYYLTPISFKRWLIRKRFGSSIHKSIIDAALDVLHPHNMHNYLHILFEELDTVCDVNVILIQFVASVTKLTLYYGKDDRWCPIGYGLDMQERKLPIQVIFCRDHCAHAFVIKHNAIISQKVTMLLLS